MTCTLVRAAPCSALQAKLDQLKSLAEGNFIDNFVKEFVPSDLEVLLLNLLETWGPRAVCHEPSPKMKVPEPSLRGPEVPLGSDALLSASFPARVETTHSKRVVSGLARNDAASFPASRPRKRRTWEIHFSMGLKSIRGSQVYRSLSADGRQAWENRNAWPSERGKREGPGVKQGVPSSDATVSRSFVRKGLGTGRGSQVSRRLNLIGLGCC